MARPTKRHMLTLERLENREVLTAGGPSNTATYLLETMNDFRSNPAYAAQWVQDHADSLVQSNIQHYGVDLNATKATIASTPAQPPLAYNPQLTTAAQGQSNDMAQKGYQSHTNSQGQNLDARLDQVGYTNRARSTEDSFAYARSADNALEAFLVDWGVPDAGHRVGMLDIGVSSDKVSSEVGIGVSTASNAAVGPDVVTIDFARKQNYQAQVVGVVYDDKQSNGRFDLNEGVGNATITATNVKTGAVQTIQSWDSGLYQLALTPGTYSITAVSGNLNLGSQTVTINDQNVHLDFRLQDGQPITTTAPVSQKSAPTTAASPSTTPATPPSSSPVVVPAAQVVIPPAPVVIPPAPVVVPVVNTPPQTSTTPAPSVVSVVQDSSQTDDWDPSSTTINWYSSWHGSR